MSLSSFDPIISELSWIRIYFSSWTIANQSFSLSSWDPLLSSFFPWVTDWVNSDSKLYYCLKSKLIDGSFLDEDIRLDLLNSNLAPSTNGVEKRWTSPTAVWWPRVMWNLDFVLIMSVKNLTFSMAAMTVSHEPIEPGAQAIPLSIVVASSWATHIPTRSPCFAVFTGFRNICIDLTFFSIWSAGICRVSPY